MTLRQIQDLITRKKAKPARIAQPGEHEVFVTPRGYLSAYISVCPDGCIGEFVAEHTDYICTLVRRCKHGYFWYSS